MREFGFLSYVPRLQSVDVEPEFIAFAASPQAAASAEFGFLSYVPRLQSLDVESEFIAFPASPQAAAGAGLIEGAGLCPASV